MADEASEGQAPEDTIIAAEQPWALWSVVQTYGWILIVAIVAGIWLWPRVVGAWQRTQQQASAQGVGMPEIQTQALIVYSWRAEFVIIRLPCFRAHICVKQYRSFHASTIVVCR